jgi:hypothetical protein
MFVMRTRHVPLSLTYHSSYLATAPIIFVHFGILSVLIVHTVVITSQSYFT